jgi:AcrR family transcriptional regulator
MDDVSARPTRRERQVAARQEQILDAAARLFAAKGFHRTTTREVAEAADIAEGTLFNYFENKNDLLFGILTRLSENEMPQEWQDWIRPAEARQFFSELLDLRQDSVEKNTVMMQAILSEILANAELRQRYLQQILQPTIQWLEKALQQLAGDEHIRPVDIPATARVLVSLWLGLFILQVLDDPLAQGERERLAEAILVLALDGIALTADVKKDRM